MKRLELPLILALLVAVFLLYHSDGKRREAEGRIRVAQQAVAKWKAEYARASMHVAKTDTLWRTAKARVDSILVTDSIPVHDTAWVVQYVERSQEALKVCSELADSCSRFRLVADSTIKAQDRHVTVLRANQRKPSDRIGAVVGYGFTQDGPRVFVGIGVKVWP